MESAIYNVGYYTGKAALIFGKVVFYGIGGVLNGAYDASVAANNSTTTQNDAHHILAEVVGNALNESAPNVTSVIDSIGQHGEGDKSTFLTFVFIGFAATMFLVLELWPEWKKYKERRRNQNAATSEKDVDLDAIVTTVADSPNEECCICMINKRTICFETCGHVATCSACTKSLVDKKCPICRKISRRFVHVVI